MHNPHETIHASHNLTIELEPGRWQLFNGAQDPTAPDLVRALLDASPAAIHCSPSFARARRLPADGELPPADVIRVVVGWAPESRNWHLGLLLASTYGEGDRPRWCGLANWPSGRVNDHEAQATKAGQALAAVIERPFFVVPPAPVSTPSAPVTPAEAAPVQTEDETLPPAPPPQPTPIAGAMPQPAPTPGAPAPAVTPRPASAPVTSSVVAEIPSRKPPFAFEDWRMIATRRGLVFQRPPRWVIGAMLRAAAYTAGAVLFVVMGLSSLESGLAQVDPEWLPYVGVGVGVVLALIALHHWWRLLSVSDVVVDVTRREVRRRNRYSGIVRWRVPFDAIQYVVLTQTPARQQGRRRDGQPAPIALDAWLHAYDGAEFWQLAALGRVEGKSHAWEHARTAQKQRGRRQLSLVDYDTPAHHAARLVAETLGRDVWLDIN